MIKDAKPGKMEFVLNALLDGISAQITSVTQSMICAEPGMKLLELANHATEVTSSMVQNVLETPLIWHHLLTHFVLPGKTANAKNALKELTSTTEFVIKSVTTAEHGTISTEDACPAIKDTTWLIKPAFSLNNKDPKILDAKSGTGQTENV